MSVLGDVLELISELDSPDQAALDPARAEGEAIGIERAAHRFDMTNGDETAVSQEIRLLASADAPPVIVGEECRIWELVKAGTIYAYFTVANGWTAVGEPDGFVGVHFDSAMDALRAAFEKSQADPVVFGIGDTVTLTLNPGGEAVVVGVDEGTVHVVWRDSGNEYGGDAGRFTLLFHHGEPRREAMDHCRLYRRKRDGVTDFMFVCEPYFMDLRELYDFCRGHNLQAIIGPYAVHNPLGCFSIWITKSNVSP